ncbi:MAG TPA: ASKHA domain-containing protein [Phycisphaerae bacterium]|nr:ASKHA domain-containing protein [Phycisphaerae bacterium]HOJ73281.1 ASKHA domain-containing protein [Phycisphaerae bacterium]HOM51153.1 ASKHA domain-containing protein [Phycisphaerae bacterium]HON68795.1 ASKHA domain-containing protein [Phycisphaerae bacterium]HOQ84500.1 ASKHA domain-containing protein [Phycisphaerae bacterium]
MSETVSIELQPLGRRFEVARGTALQDVLFAHGVEFPCGGHGRCKGCRVRVVAGELPITAKEREVLNTSEIAAGWRLACCGRADGDLTLDIGQWEETILADNSQFAFTPKDGLGVAVDLGTTTLVAQLVDRQTGRVLAVESALNPQAAYGADIMSRVQFGVEPAGREKLRDLIRTAIGGMVERLQREAGDGGTIQRVAIVGNTVMHHLFCGLDVTPLSIVPFETDHAGLQSFTAADLGWHALPSHSRIDFLPALGSFVGSDILAGVLATRLHESDAPVGLVDLGTNGEIVVGNRERMLCASTAAGPAFEGARISMGMRAATGAISEVRVKGDTLTCHVIGNTAPRGICGSGLVDAVAAGLELGTIQPTGRLADGAKEWVLAEPVRLTQGDIRELQLAKAAIHAGIGLLIEQWGIQPRELSTLYIAGAFGNYINLTSARRIGLIDFDLDRVRVVGNTALLGAKMALFDEDANQYAGLLGKIDHVPLASDAKFMDAYVDAMTFPENRSER